MSKSQRTPKNSRLSQINATLHNASVDRKRELQSLLAQGITLNENIENKDSDEVLKEVRAIIERANELSKECSDALVASKDNTEVIFTASENVVDASVLKIGHEIVGNIAARLGHREFSEAAHAEKICSQIREGGKLNWNKYGEMIFDKIKCPRFGVSFLGTFDGQAEAMVHPKKERVMRQKAEIGEMKRPEKVTTLEKEEKGAQLLQQVRTQIESEYLRRGNVPFPYYELILDRDDFMHTVDNAFHVAFLVRDGHVGLACDENDDPIVYVPTKTQKQLKEHEKSTKQAIVGLNYGKWLKAKEHYGENEPILKLDRSELITSTQATQQT
ncbi:non-structural maintenance of chromosomes element 4 homolog A [Culicoides brevitarsis]|uniref:non-structural maintenance of chromosomes element 4 homolog A n=1 Tax=Culicoides brevitarsis TaxID=469753 RepID=UPI00307C2A82